MLGNGCSATTAEICTTGSLAGLEQRQASAQEPQGPDHVGEEQLFDHDVGSVGQVAEGHDAGGVYEHVQAPEGSGCRCDQPVPGVGVAQVQHGARRPGQLVAVLLHRGRVTARTSRAPRRASSREIAEPSPPVAPTTATTGFAFVGGGSPRTGKILSLARR